MGPRRARRARGGVRCSAGRPAGHGPRLAAALGALAPGPRPAHRRADGAPWPARWLRRTRLPVARGVPAAQPRRRARGRRARCAAAAERRRRRSLTEAANRPTGVGSVRHGAASRNARRVQDVDELCGRPGPSRCVPESSVTARLHAGRAAVLRRRLPACMAASFAAIHARPRGRVRWRSRLGGRHRRADYCMGRQACAGASDDGPDPSGGSTVRGSWRWPCRIPFLTLPAGGRVIPPRVHTPPHPSRRTAYAVAEPRR